MNIFKVRGSGQYFLLMFMFGMFGGKWSRISIGILFRIPGEENFWKSGLGHGQRVSAAEVDNLLRTKKTAR